MGEGPAQPELPGFDKLLKGTAVLEGTAIQPKRRVAHRPTEPVIPQGVAPEEFAKKLNEELKDRENRPYWDK